MNKLAKTFFIIAGCITPIFIGGLHLFVHFKDLIQPKIQNYLQKEMSIFGTEQALWYTWGIVSFMMGASFIIIGLLNIATIKKLHSTDHLPILSIISMMIYQLCVIYVGFEFEQNFQFYGGFLGLILFSISLVLTLRIKNKII